MSDKILKEGRFEFDFSKSIAAFKADSPQYHGLSAVDFIVETDDTFLFIEVKDPEHPKSLKFGNPEKFIADLENPIMISRKFNDSLLKEFAKGKEFQKPVICILILEWSKYDSEQRIKIFENISSTIPKFKEDSFPKIAEMNFKGLHNITSFSEAFPMFKITEVQ